MVERIERVDVRAAWPHEARDLSRWLADNLDLLDEQLGLGLDADTVRLEEATGTLSVDLVAEAADGTTVVVENQLGRSDHDHLGKLMTYLAAFEEAATAVWVVGEARPEHVRAVTWLNDSSPARWFLLQVEAVRIAGGLVAGMLTRIVGPAVDAVQVTAVRQDQRVRHEARHAFWTQLLAAANPRTPLHRGRSPGEDPALDAGSGHSGVTWVYYARQHDSAVALYILRADGPWNERVFEGLRTHREAIEAAFGAPLEWQASNNKSRRVYAGLDVGGWADADQWPAVIDATVEAMIRLEAAVRPYLSVAVAAADRPPAHDAGGEASR